MKTYEEQKPKDTKEAQRIKACSGYNPVVVSKLRQILNQHKPQEKSK